MNIGEIIDYIFFWGRKPPEAIKWEDLRKRILETIDEEKERRADIIISPSNVGTLSHKIYEQKGYTHTADEDSCIYNEEDVLHIPVV